LQYNRDKVRINAELSLTEVMCGATKDGAVTYGKDILRKIHVDSG